VVDSIIANFLLRLSGIVASTAVGLVVQYYNWHLEKPVMQMEEASKRGVAINLITGIAYGLRVVFALSFHVGIVIFSFIITTVQYRRSRSQLGKDFAIGIIMAGDGFWSISDNAQE